MNILITGGSGFIGSHLISKLELNHNIINIDLINGGDITKYETFDKISQPIDVIYHLAAQPYGKGGELNPYLDLNTNTKGTLNVNLFAYKKNIKKIIYTSTMAVYGDNDNCIETDIPNPLSNYAVSKLFGEYSIKKHHIPYTIFRLWNTYGPGQDLNNPHKGLVQAMCNQIVSSTDIKVTGSLDRYRDLIYIDDVIDALILGLDNNTNNEIYNVSTGKKTTINTLIQTIIKVINNNKQYNIKNIGGHKGDQFGCVGNSTKLQNLGWTPNTDIRIGLKNFLHYIKTHNNA